MLQVFNKKFSRAVILLSSFACAGNAFALPDRRHEAEVLNKSAYAAFFKGSLFQTTSYLDPDGAEVEMAEESDYKLMDLDFALSYGLTSSLELTGFGRFRSVQSTMNGESVSNNGPESLGLYAKYSFPLTGEIRYALGVHYSQTLYDNTLYVNAAAVPADEIVLGDSGSEYGVDLLMTYGLRALKWDLKLGYNSPANDLSEEIVYKFEGSYQFTKWGVYAGVEGIKSLNRDPYSDSPLLKPIQATGVTAQFNSINREKVFPYAGATYAFDSFLINFRGGSIIAGQSIDKGNRMELAIQWASQGVTKESIKVESFKEYTIDGSVLKISARGNFVRIDQGLSTDVEKGMRFDIYQTDYFGGNVLVATGVAYEVGADWTVIKLTKKYKEIEIKPGFAARGFENP
jgi:hypothetical protein